MEEDQSSSPKLRTIDREIVSAVIQSRDGKLLFGKKDPKKGGVYSDCWHIPGGGVDEGESRGDALKRELLEEVGLDTDSCEVSLLDDKGAGVSEKRLKDTEELVNCNMKFLVYLVKVEALADDIDLSLDDDLVEVVWLERKDLKKYKMTPPSVELFSRLGWL